MKNMGFNLIIVAVIAVFITGCPFDKIKENGTITNEKIKGNGNITSTERIAKGFNGILLEGVANLNIHFSENYKVVVTTDSIIQDFITIKVKNSLLYVNERRTQDVIKSTKIIIDIYLPELENITSKGVGNIEIDSWNDSVLSLTLSGVGNIFYKGNPTINLNRTGIGNVKKL
jgi:uncharacterized Fe-S radical SAM superfamily protein PflX